MPPGTPSLRKFSQFRNIVRTISFAMGVHMCAKWRLSCNIKRRQEESWLRIQIVVFPSNSLPVASRIINHIHFFPRWITIQQFLLGRVQDVAVCYTLLLRYPIFVVVSRKCLCIYRHIVCGKHCRLWQMDHSIIHSFNFTCTGRDLNIVFLIQSFCWVVKFAFLGE